MSDPTLAALTPEQIESLRKLLAQHDAQSPRDENVFDPNKPPKEAYRHKEFPKMMYDEHGRVLKVNSAEEEEAADAKGYKTDPHPAYDYSRINRNSMRAERADVEEEVNDEDEREAERAIERAERKAAALKKAGKSKSADPVVA